MGGRLVYSAIASLDGYVADEDGGFDWAAPGREVHAFVNVLERPIGSYLYGCRTYEVIVAWDDPAPVAGASDLMRDFADLWHAAEEVVYSTSGCSTSAASPAAPCFSYIA